MKNARESSFKGQVRHRYQPTWRKSLEIIWNKIQRGERVKKKKKETPESCRTILNSMIHVCIHSHREERDRMGQKTFEGIMTENFSKINDISSQI